MPSLDDLRLAVALAHAVPAAEVRLRCGNGDAVVVGRSPGADLDPCTMRRIVIAAAIADASDFTQRIAAISIGGAIDHMGGGIYRRTCHGHEQRWIATLLDPAVVAELLGACTLDGLSKDAMHACIKPDFELGVTCVAITTNDVEHEHMLDAVAVQAMTTCLVEELLHSARQDDHDVIRQERLGPTGHE